MFNDPLGRSAGEALDPTRHTPEKLLIRAKGNPRLYAAVWNQSPRSLGGNILNINWFQRIKRFELPQDHIKWIRAYDLAFSEKEVAKPIPDFTAGAKFGFYKKGKEYNFFIDNIVRWQDNWPATRKKMLEIAPLDNCRYLIVEGGGPQKGLGEALQADAEFAPYSVKIITPVKDKVARAQYWADKAEIGKIYLVDGEWVKPFLDECEAFNAGAHDDQVDAVSLAFWFIMSKYLRGTGVKAVKVKGLYSTKT